MEQALENYESLSAITALMRDAAMRAEWDRLIALELQCKESVQRMKIADANIQLSAEGRKRKVELIHRILEDDAVIRNHTEPWMVQLQRIMQSSNMGQRLMQTYAGRS